MNKTFIFTSIVASGLLIYFGHSFQEKVEDQKTQNSQIQSTNLDIKQKISEKDSLIKQDPIPIATEYSEVLNQIRLLESYGGTSMSVQLQGRVDSEDISSHYEQTEYSGIRGLKIQIVVDKFSKETDMGAVLDDIHLLEMNTDFMASEITKDNNNLIVKGEVYGL